MSVRIIALGHARVFVSGREKTDLPQQRLRCALLVYLAAEREATRESVVSVFWPDKEPSKARHLLSQTLYELRKLIGHDAITAEGDRVCIAPEVSLDARDFEQLVEQGDVDTAIGMYAGPFLASFQAPGTNSFETWVDRKRAHLARLNRRAHRERIDALRERDDLSGALAGARAWADQDPLDDEAQHRLIELLLATRARVEARAHFDQYQQLLRKELDVAPLEETIALFEKDTASPPEPGAAVTAESPAPVHVIGAPTNARQVEPLRPPPDVRRTIRTGQPPAAGLGDRATSAWHPAARRRRTLGLIGVVVLIALAGAWLLADREPGGEPALESLALPLDQSGFDPTRIAVLYFDDLSEQGDLGHIANGLTEALINELTSIEALSVVTRNGVKPFAGAAVTLESIATALRVGSIVDGSLQRSGDQIRVTVQLIEASTGRQLQSRVVDRPVGELFQLQDDIVHHVARFLRDRLGREIAVRRRLAGTTSVQAWLLAQEAVNLGEELWEAETVIPDFRRASAEWALRSADSLLVHAERLDPHWNETVLLRGWAALGRAKVTGTRDTVAYNRWIAEGLRHTQRLLERDSTDPRGLELRGTLKVHLARANPGRPDASSISAGAARDLSAAVARDPKLARAWNALSRLYQFEGDPAQANLFAQRARAEDAYLRESPDILQRLFRTSLDLEDVQQARRWCLTGYEDHPGDWRFLQCQLQLPALAPRGTITVDSAAALLRALNELDPPSARTRGNMYRYTYRDVLLAAVLAHAGRTDEARDSIAHIRERIRGQHQLELAFRHDDAYMNLLLGDTAAALDAIRRYVDAHPIYRSYIRGSSLFRALREDPRFLQILADPADTAVPRN